MSSQEMVQTPFTWRYGGRHVFLSGSFNGWSERIPLVLMEGSETIFQKIIDLLPGCYQYKFLVDGTWRVDQQQACDTDNYGTMNNVVLVSATSLTSQNVRADAMQSVGSSSGVSLSEPVLPLSDGEMDVFRQALLMHLLSSTAYDLIPNSGKINVLDLEVDVEEAFHVMYELGLTVLPIRDESSRQIAGMLTASDFILILLQLHGDLAMFANKELQARTISSWKKWKLRHADVIRTTIPFQRTPLIHVDADESLAGVASRIIQNNISVVPIIHSANGSSPRLLHVACLSGILRNVCNHFRHHLGHLSLLQQPVGYLPLGSWAAKLGRTFSRPLMTLRPNDTLRSVLSLLLDAQISSIPIVDDGGNFLNLYSKSDITSLARDNIYTQVQLDQITVSQALELSGERGRTRYKTCTRFDSLYHVMELLSEPDVRRLVVVEASSPRVEGIITLRDVFNLLSS